MLTAADAPAYLTDRGLLTPAGVLGGGFAVREVSRRNASLRVEAAAGQSYFVKQAGAAQAQDTGIAVEAAVYEALGGHASRALRSLLPRMVRFDADAGVLVLELVPGAEDLQARLRRGRRVPLYAMRTLGAGLAALHSIRGDDPGSPAGLPSRGAPWPLLVSRPSLAQYEDMSWGDLALIRLLQGQAGFGELLEDVAAGWRATALIHHDIKWENCLVTSGNSGRRGVRVVDWEFAGWGDPAWDAACVLAAFLTSWVQSMRPPEPTPVEMLPRFAAYPLDKMHPAIRAFWLAYARAGAGDAFLLRVMRYCGARLVESAMGETQAAADVSGHARLLLQLALNVLREPVKARGLLGLAA